MPSAHDPSDPHPGQVQPHDEQPGILQTPPHDEQPGGKSARAGEITLESLISSLTSDPSLERLILLPPMKSLMNSVTTNAPNKKDETSNRLDILFIFLAIFSRYLI